MSFDEILSASQSSSSTDQARLIDSLVSGVQQQGEIEVSSAWWAEIDRRSHLLVTGKASYITWEEARQRACKVANA